MSLFIFVVLIFSSFIAQNKKIEHNLKVGYFAVVGIILGVYMLLSIL